MDFLDPKKQRHHQIILLVGYVLIAIAITIATVILLVIAYGFGRGKDGQVVQRGIVFFSSTPSGANISLDGKDTKATTNTRQQLIGGSYLLSLTRAGYRTWQRQISIDGGSIAHYDYPFLFPTTLKTTPLKAYDAAPSIVLQSPGQRWLLLGQPNAIGTFDMYDRDNPKSTMTTLTLPTDLLTAGSDQNWQLVEWAADNDHVLLQHLYDGKSEFIMVDRTDPTQSVNLNKQLGLDPSKITLRDQKYDQYYVYDASTQSLQTASLQKPTPEPYLDHVLNYQSYGSDIMLYASSAASSSSKVAIDLLQGGKTYNLREVSAGSTYLLDLTQYSGDWYAVVGASSESKLYVYKNPVTQLNSKLGILVPIAILKTPNPTYVSFSNNARFIVSENGAQFAVFDAENEETYAYTSKQPVDAPQLHASWMDGHRLTYVSAGKLVVFDFDDANIQMLMAASPNYMPFFTSNYKFVDTIAAPDTAGKTTLDTTSLRTPADQ